MTAVTGALARPLAASKGKRRTFNRQPATSGGSYCERPYGDAQSRGTDPQAVATEMRDQRDMAVRGYRLRLALARKLGRITNTEGKTL